MQCIMCCRGFTLFFFAIHSAPWLLYVYLVLFLEKGTDESFGIFILIKKSENNAKGLSPKERKKMRATLISRP